MPGPDESDFDPATLTEIRRFLAVDELAARRVAALRTPAEPGSMKAEDARLPDARFVTIYAGQASAAAIDHLLAWRLLVHGRSIPIGAHLTLLRAALECAVRCRWHVDPGADAATRVGRGHAARRDDQVARRTFEASREGGARPTLSTKGLSAVERLAAFDAPEAIRAREAAGVRSVGYTDTTSLMVTYGHERLFRLLSGLAHAKEWALVATDLQRSAEPSHVAKMSHGTVSASEPVARAATLVVVGAVRSAIADLEAYCTARPADRSTGRPPDLA